MFQDALLKIWEKSAIAATQLSFSNLKPVGVDLRKRRRFFHAGGATQSRTEVVAEAVVNAKHTKRATAALERAQSRLAEALA